MVAGVVGLQKSADLNDLEQSATIESPAETSGNPGPCRTLADPKPYADIRRALVEGIRKNPDKPARLKHEAEVLIATIQNIRDEGENDDNRRAFHENYARLMRVAEGAL